ncbi:homoserine kinase [Halovenus rubra]|uniref:Homoserine kinase n=2 Tax=Halovenus rubra TaxID=869890 RepID=A0ACC7E252_9EURY|nr:homoserine kinase [Halovenus rubra]
MLTVRAPATSANLGSGFDVFGVALSGPADVLRVEKATRTTLTVVGSGSQYIPEDPKKNTVGAVVDELDAPARIRIDKGVRPASGLGSSAASAAGAAVALNELYDRGYSREELVPVAAKGEAVATGEAHKDNVAPSLLGGFTIVADGCVTTMESDLSFVVCLPDVVVSTSNARKVLPDGARLDELVETVGNASTLTAGIARDDPYLVGRGMSDPVITPARASLIDGYETVHNRAVEAGAAGVTVSGSGPGVIAVCPDGLQRRVAAAMVGGFEDCGVDARAYQTGVGEGAQIVRNERNSE